MSPWLPGPLCLSGCGVVTGGSGPAICCWDGRLVAVAWGCVTSVGVMFLKLQAMPETVDKKMAQN